MASRIINKLNLIKEDKAYLLFKNISKKIIFFQIYYEIMIMIKRWRKELCFQKIKII